MRGRARGTLREKVCEGRVSRHLRMCGNRAARGVQRSDAGSSETETEGWAQGDPQMRHPKGQEKAEMGWYGACKNTNDSISSRELPHFRNSVFVGLIAARGDFGAFGGGRQAWSRAAFTHSERIKP